MVEIGVFQVDKRGRDTSDRVINTGKHGHVKQSESSRIRVWCCWNLTVRQGLMREETRVMDTGQVN